MKPADEFPSATWRTATPEECGLDSPKLHELVERLQTPAENRRNGPTAENPGSYGCVIRHGLGVLSWGDPTVKFNWYSASKPVLSTLLFLAIQEGRLGGVDDRIADQGWDLVQKDLAMTFAHLANMTSGYTLPEPPGEAYAYNDFAIHLYALSLDRVFGGLGLNEPAARLLADLRLQDGEVFGASHRGYGVVTTPRDFARIGWLWMHRGRWGRRQVLAQSFMDRYCRPGVRPDLPISPHQETDDYLGIGSYGGRNNQHRYGPGLYGFNWWFNAIAPAAGQPNWPDAPADTFAALGFGGNRMFMVPSLDLLIAARGNWGAGSPGSREGYNQALDLLLDAVKD